MNIFVTGDIHGSIDIKKFSSENFPQGKPLTKNDYIIICGDFGLIWSPDQSSKEEQYWLDWLSNKPWTTLFCDGNHENFDRLNEFPIINKFNSKVGQITDSIFHLKRGEVYTISDKKFFVMGGGKSIDKKYRIPHKSWWPQEEPNYKELDNGYNNLQNHNWNVDYIIAHTCPLKILKIINKTLNYDYSAKIEFLNRYFDMIVKKTQFEKFYFGHFHDDVLIDNKYQMLYNTIMEIK